MVLGGEEGWVEEHLGGHKEGGFCNGLAETGKLVYFFEVRTRLSSEIRRSRLERVFDHGFIHMCNALLPLCFSLSTIHYSHTTPQRSRIPSSQSDTCKPLSAVLMRMSASSQSFQTLTNQFPIILLNLRHSFYKQFIFLLIEPCRSCLLCSLKLAHGAVFFIKLAGLEDFPAVHGYEGAVAFVAIVYCGACDGSFFSGGDTVGGDDFGDFVEG